MNKLFAILSTVFIFESVAQADTCPIPPSSVDPSISAQVSFEKKTGTFTYKYGVLNGQSSLIPINTLRIQMSQSPMLIQAPSRWRGRFQSLAHMPFNVIWSTASLNTDIPPGHRLAGFSFQSSQPPGAIQYYVDGDTGVPESSPPSFGAADDEPEPNCPGWSFDMPKFQTLVTGLTTGPLASGTISVSIRLRDEDAEHRCAPINPASPVGKLSLLILATKSFDPSQIVVSSIKFGPNGVSPLSSKLVGRRDDDDRDEEREEWERVAASLGNDQDRDPKRQNLLLVFDQAALGIQCVLDKAVFLTGQVQDGTKIMGGASTRTVGCDIRKPGVRHSKGSKDEFFSAFKKIHRIQRAKPLTNQ